MTAQDLCRKINHVCSHPEAVTTALCCNRLQEGGGHRFAMCAVLGVAVVSLQQLVRCLLHGQVKPAVAARIRSIARTAQVQPLPERLHPGVCLAKAELNIKYCRFIWTCPSLEHRRMPMRFDMPGLLAPDAPCKISGWDISSQICN